MTVLRLSSCLTLAGALALAGCSSGGEALVGSPVGSAAVTLSATTLSFGTIPLGQTSAEQNLTITNTGAGAGLTLTSRSLGGNNPSAFLSTSTCPASLARGASCTVSIAYAPTASAAQTATLALLDNAGNSPQLVALSGTGSSSGPVVSLSATSLTFTRLPVGQAATQTVTLSNIGSYALNLSGFTVGGTNATSFAVSGSCLTSATVAAGASCFLTVTYAPTVAGALSAIINVNDNAPNTPQTIALTSS